MGTAEPFIQAVEAAYPDFVVETAVFIEEGQYNHVLLLNDSFWPRIRFYKGTFALFEALYGIENGDDLAFERGMEAYV